MGTTIRCLERGVVDDAQRIDHRSDTGYPAAGPGEMRRVRKEPPPDSRPAGRIPLLYFLNVLSASSGLIDEPDCSTPFINISQ